MRARKTHSDRSRRNRIEPNIARQQHTEADGFWQIQTQPDRNTQRQTRADGLRQKQAIPKWSSRTQAETQAEQNNTRQDLTLAGAPASWQRAGSRSWVLSHSYAPSSIHGYSSDSQLIDGQGTCRTSFFLWFSARKSPYEHVCYLHLRYVVSNVELDSQTWCSAENEPSVGW